MTSMSPSRSGRSARARQSLDIGRVTALAERLEIERPVVLFDEPTTALDQEHEENFLKLLERLRGHASVVFVSHRLPEIIRTTDRITVFKDGESAADRRRRRRRERAAPADGRPRADRELLPRARPAAGPAEAVPRLVVQGVSGAGVLREASFEVAPGEILGIAGTEGSGKRVLGEIIAGVVTRHDGPGEVDGQVVGGGLGGHVDAGSPTSHRIGTTRV